MNRSKDASSPTLSRHLRTTDVMQSLKPTRQTLCLRGQTGKISAILTRYRSHRFQPEAIAVWLESRRIGGKR